LRIAETDSAGELIAYEIHQPPGMTLRTAPVEREWMNESRDRFAYRCLPLVIANQSGWVVPCPAAFVAAWNGGPKLADLFIDFLSQPPDARISSHFGEGVLTFALPFLFRTPPGINL